MGLSGAAGAPKLVAPVSANALSCRCPWGHVPMSDEVPRCGRSGSTADRDALLAAWLDDDPDGIECVIGDPSFAGTGRVRSLTPVLAKGREFDRVVLVDPPPLDAGTEAAVDRDVGMTRAAQRLAILTSG
jgi:hypothetical protein